MLNFKSLVLFSIFTLASSVSMAGIKKDYFKVTNVKIKEVEYSEVTEEYLDVLYRKGIYSRGSTPTSAKPSELETAGKVISIGKDLVALGEDIYKLVTKGKPHNTTSYAPISVVPKLNGEAVDILTTEYWNVPLKRSYKVIYENIYGADVVTFQFAVIYSYGGSYNGKGKYLTSVQIIPEQVRTLFGFDFTATMKLGGIQNLGSRENPIAGATLLLESTVNSVMVAHTDTYSFHVDGLGGFMSY